MIKEDLRHWPKIVEVTSCLNPIYWYNKSLYKRYVVVREVEEGYIVRADDGYLNVILAADAQTIEDDEQYGK
jgi:hypothetical protein